MSWKVKATAWNASGPKTKIVAEVDEYDDIFLRQIAYWVRNMEPGEKVVIKRFHPGHSG